jgi:TrmH family RNA methyltransferase
MTITSPHNEHLKEIRKLNQRRRARAQSGRFVAEGEDLLAAADAAGWEPVERYCAAGSGLPGTEVEPKLLAAASELGSGTRALAVYTERWAPAPSGPLCVYLHGVHDPGNVGTILRSAEAFGAASVAIGPGTADPFGPKAVRASMGAVFTVALARVATLADLPGTTVALDTGDDVTASLETVTPGATGALTLLIGGERVGLPEALLQSADHVARIPIVSHSLNAAMAATVALYEASRMARK